ncbi:hypothetical protein ACFQHO_15675 [Actinomadura yumaensis]|uniref:hypothetical protein n=1 Tax=Actinomadura yumaensis TaxID=111807 RepID=UPI003612B1BB
MNDVRPGASAAAVAGLRIAIVNWRDPWHPAAGAPNGTPGSWPAASPPRAPASRT